MTEAGKTCDFCGRYSVDLRSVGNRSSCGICRAIDRIRGVCNRLPVEHAASTLSVLFETEGRLRDLRHFGGKLPEGTPLIVDPPGPESLSGILNPGGKPEAPHEKPSGHEPGSSSGARSSSHRVPAESGRDSKVKRKKKNRGKRRAEWQDLKCKIKSGQRNDTVGGDLDWSESEEECS